MAQEVLRSREASSTLTVRDLALISGFAGILVADGYVSSLARAVTRTTDTFFLIAALFTVLALMTRKHWTSTLLALVTGLIFLATPGAPFPPDITMTTFSPSLSFPPASRSAVEAAPDGSGKIWTSLIKVFMAEIICSSDTVSTLLTFLLQHSKVKSPTEGGMSPSAIDFESILTG